MTECKKAWMSLSHNKLNDKQREPDMVVYYLTTTYANLTIWSTTSSKRLGDWIIDNAC